MLAHEEVPLIYAGIDFYESFERIGEVAFYGFEDEAGHRPRASVLDLFDYQGCNIAEGMNEKRRRKENREKKIIKQLDFR